MVDTGTVIIAVAGVAGTIGGAVLGAWLTGKSLSANLGVQLDFQARQARDDAKRRVYAQSLTAFHEAWLSRMRTETESSARAQSESGRKMQAATLAVTEIRLVGPISVANMAVQIMASLDRGKDPLGFSKPFAALMASMRKDLGEPD